MKIDQPLLPLEQKEYTELRIREQRAGMHRKPTDKRPPIIPLNSNEEKRLEHLTKRLVREEVKAEMQGMYDHYGYDGPDFEY